MPSRIIREGINDSKAVNGLTDQAEVFYRRLLLVVDDFGRFESDLTLLRAKLFAYKLEQWPEDRIKDALGECSHAINGDDEPLVLMYAVGKKQLLQISNFGQRTRTSKYPGPGDLSPEANNGAKGHEKPPKQEKEKKPAVLTTSTGAVQVGSVFINPDVVDRIKKLAADAPDKQDLKAGINLALTLIAESPDWLETLEIRIPLWFAAMRDGRARVKTLRYLIIDKDYLHEPAKQRKAPDRDQRRREEANLVAKALRRK